jgi:hypothetical protein
MPVESVSLVEMNCSSELEKYFMPQGYRVFGFESIGYSILAPDGSVVLSFLRRESKVRLESSKDEKEFWKIVEELRAV